MGIFDNRLVSKFIPKEFFPDTKAEQVGQQYVYQQQSGCGVKLYPNRSNGSVRRLFFEIENCSVDRSTTDIGGGWSFTLLPTEPWDEIIRPGDFIRIFMGDQIIQSKVPPNAYNFASGPLDHDKTIRDDVVFTPLPGSGYSYTPDQGVKYTSQAQQKYLIMYERMLGKVDRVQPIEEASGDGSSGYSKRYVVSGRSFGAIIQDLSLYYNEWLPGLNAVNVFFQSNVGLIQSPSEFVRDVLSIVLSSVPLPQWQLPLSLVSDLNFGNIFNENSEFAQEKLAKFKTQIQSNIATNTAPPGAADAITELNRLIKELDNNPSSNPFNVLSTKSIKPTFGATFNKSFLNSTTTGLQDMLKHLSNEAFNELWYDLTPGGVVDSGSLDAQVGVPTLVIRQRPYDITPEMLKNLGPHLSEVKDRYTKFGRAKDLVPEATGLAGASSSLDEIANNAITIYTREQQSDVKKYLDDLNKAAVSSPLFIPGQNYVPTALKVETGYSDHDRLNAFLCLGQYNRGQQNQTDRILASSNGGFTIDPQSIRKYGFRIMELSTIYAQPDDQKNSQQDYGILLKGFSKLIANWYFMNQDFLNGRITCRFLPDARLGVPVKLFNTKKSPYNPYPKMELYYCQGVSDTFQFGQPITTTLTVIRGIRYNLNAESGKGLKDEINKLTTARDRVKKFFSSLGGLA